MTDDLDDEELYRRMKRKLLLDGPSNRGQHFTVEEQAIADRLLGKSESQRLQNRRDNSRPFKPKAPVVVAEYYEVPPMETMWSSFGGGWRIDVRENGILRNSKENMSREECLKMVAALERRGAKAKPIVTEWMKCNPDRPKAEAPTGRKSFADRYGDFDPEVDD